MTQLGWIHFSPAFKSKVDSILDRLDEEGVVDELGVGVFRDAIADYFFPGTSTIQTRARYFFIIPYLIKDFLQQKGRRQDELDRYLYDQEHELMWRLAAKYGFNRTAGFGVIGITKKPKQRIARRPSSIYWNGLRTFHFIQTDLSLAGYSQWLSRSMEHRSERLVRETAADDADVEQVDWHGIKVSTYRHDWLLDLDLPLLYEEADFFLQRIKDLFPQTLLGQLAMGKNLWENMRNADGFETFARTAQDSALPDQLKQQLRFAHDLSIVVEGLHWVYCHLIHVKHYSDHQFAGQFEIWLDELYDRLLDVEQLHLDTFFDSLPRARPDTLQFIVQVLNLVRTRQLSMDAFAVLVQKQEIRIKGQKSRLRDAALRDFQQSEQKSLFALNYRFGNVRTLLNDIFQGLSQ
ncbi:MAG: hypothetical protein KDD14_07415 [Saprospiraceae bacterium]|nr:hypothetical protein [Saprospiraceae bacterium]